MKRLVLLKQQTFWVAKTTRKKRRKAKQIVAGDVFESQLLKASDTESYQRGGGGVGDAVRVVKGGCLGTKRTQN